MALPLRHLILLVGLLAALAPRLPAATTPDAPRGVTFHLCCVGVVADMLYDCDGQPRSVFTGQSVSAPLPAPADRKLLFYRTHPAPNPSDPPVRIPLATTVLPDGPGPYLVLLSQGPLPTPENPSPLPYSVLVTDYSLAASPADSFRVFNISQHLAAVKLGAVLFELRPGESRLVPYPKTPTTWLQVAVADSSGWHPVAGALQVIAPGTRGSIFLAEIPRPSNFAKLALPTGPLPPALFVSSTFDKPPPPPPGQIAQN